MRCDRCLVCTKCVWNAWAADLGTGFVSIGKCRPQKSSECSRQTTWRRWTMPGTQYPLTPKSKWKALQHDYKLHKCECLEKWKRPQRNRWPQDCGRILEHQCFLWRGIRTDTLLQVCYGKDSSKRFCLEIDGRKHQPGNACLCVVSKVYSYQCTWTSSNWLGRSAFQSLCGED